MSDGHPPDDVRPTEYVTKGQNAALIFQCDVPIDPQIVVHFTAFMRVPNPQTGDSSNLMVDWWDETLIATEFAGKQAQAKRTYMAKWIVRLENYTQPLRDPVSVDFVVTATSGRHRITINNTNSLTIGVIAVTNNPALTRIMRNEFLKETPVPGQSRGSFEMDRAPLQDYVDSLSIEQRSFLINYPLEDRSNRLVVFLTVYAKEFLTRDRSGKTRPHPLNMGADYCLPEGQKILDVRPNATFAVFHCRKGEPKVELVCLTEHFLINLFNTPTRRLFQSFQEKKRPEEWMNKRNPSPPRFFLGACVPDNYHNNPIYNLVFDSQGRDVMPGSGGAYSNSLHGIINTNGCWMLFRNYNWPADNYENFATVMNHLFRAKKNKEGAKKLIDLGYDVLKREGGFSDSYTKYWDFDRNYAYLWFFHEIVGIKYFSKKEESPVNDRPVCARTLDEKTFPLNEAKGQAEFTLPEEGDFNGHNFTARSAAGPFKPDASLWRQNALGFKAAEDFVGGAGNILKTDLSKRTWADLYFYREDGVDMKSWKGNYLEY